MRQIKATEATRRELFAFLTEQKGVPLVWKESLRTDQLMAELGRIGHESEYITVSDEEEKPVKASKAAKAEPEDEYVHVRIERTEEHDGGQPASLSVNGRAILIPRGVTSKIHKKYLEVLKNAVRTVSRWDERTGEITTRDVPTYPFQVVSV